MKLTINSKILDFVAVGGFFLIAAAEGKVFSFVLAGFLGVGYLTVISFRIFLAAKAKKI